MKFKLIAITTLILLSISKVCFAAYVANIEIGRIHTKSNGYVYFEIAGTPPADTCTWYRETFRFNGTSEAGKAMFSNLLASKASGSLIDIWYAPSSTPGTNQSNGCLESTIATVYGIGQE